MNHSCRKYLDKLVLLCEAVRVTEMILCLRLNVLTTDTKSLQHIV